jgi:hypothetical protein
MESNFLVHIKPESVHINGLSLNVDKGGREPMQRTYRSKICFQEGIMLWRV